MSRIILGISSCVAGEAVRYNGESSKMPALFKKIQHDFDWLPFCPEVAAGMSTPRETVRLVASSNGIVMRGNKTQHDWTAALNHSSADYLEQIRSRGLSGYIVKGKSPSCGLGSTKLYDENDNIIRKTAGLFTQQLQDTLQIPCIEAEMLNSPEMADRFLLQVNLTHTFQQLPVEGLQKRHLIDLYASYKLLLMAYSPVHYQAGGRLLGISHTGSLHSLKDKLYKIMLDGLTPLSNRHRHTNALMHIQGYFKQQLGSTEKRELSGIIHGYQNGQLPLSVPMTMLKHYLLMHPQQYLQKQRYLHPYDERYGLRNHL